MKKNIVVLVSEIANDYSFSVLDGIYSYFADKDVNLITIPTRRGGQLSAKHYWIGMKLAEAEQVDGVIVLSAIYLSAITKEELAKSLEHFHTKNIVSISTKLPIENSTYTYVTCDNAYNTIVEHLKNEHGCKNIAFMSAIQTGSEEAQQRFDAFKKAMDNNGLTFNPKLLFEGKFVYDSAYDALKKRYEGKKKLDFDAIVAANDMMAFACISFVDSMGLKVPEDVKVVGYDDIIQAQTAELTLSTINQQMELQGKTAAELVYKRANGEEVPEATPIEIKPIFRKSCGCSSTESDFIKKMQEHTGNRNMSVMLHLEKNMIQQNIYYLLESLQNEMTLDKLFDMFDTILPERFVPGIAVCMYDKPLYIEEDKQIELPSKATVRLFIDKTCNIKETNLKISFDPHKMILPQEFFGKDQCRFMIQPIIFGHKQYGYFVSKCPSTDYLFVLIYLKTFSAIIAQSYIFTNQLEENAKLSSENLLLQIDNTALSEISMIDSLTGAFNRRGLMEMGKETINLALKMGSQGIVFFADMDDLKKINDNYGHDMGDKAIQTEAEIFKTVFRQNDVIGRLGGDEFAGVIPGMPAEHIEKAKEAIKEAGRILAKQNGLPFDISISFGAVEFGPENSDLNTLITLADKEQYIEKRKHHAGRK